MFFYKKAHNALLRAIDAGSDSRSAQSFCSQVMRQFQRNKRALWAFRIITLLLFIALFADVLANDRPLICSFQHNLYFPAFRGVLVDWGWLNWQPELSLADWHYLPYDWSLHPLIPYTAQNLNISEQMLSPFSAQTLSLHYRHWLGTDDMGRDVLACMIYGTRIAFSVGIVSMSIAVTIGIILGSVAGFYGDDGFQTARINLWTMPFWVGIAYFYGFFIRSYTLLDALGVGLLYFLIQFLFSLFIAFAILVLGRTLLLPFRDSKYWSKPLALPIDLIITRFIEMVVSLPAIILILAVSAITKPSIFNIMVIMGLIGWTSIARFVRAELLRIRQLEYVEAAKVLGFGSLRILIRHALPNALAPVVIALAFGIAGAILLEAFISFLGLGLPAEVISWGKMLASARSAPSAWWLALLPGSAIFITVTLFNIIGEGLTDALDPRLAK
jgi:peptide/nickel transport system permease protein